jgi:HK97 family phage portal protein
VVAQCIDRIATHGAKLMPRHIQDLGDSTRNVKGDINFLLQNQPNPIMNRFIFQYKVIANLEADNNSFIFIAKNREGFITGFYPITSYEEKLLQDKSGKIFLKFKFINGQTYTLPYEELIHLRKFFRKDDIFGTNNKTLRTDVETAQTSSEGMKNAIQLSNKVKGLLHFTNSLLKNEDLQNAKDRFVRDFLSLENRSGIVALDGKATFQELNIKPITLDSDQLKMVNNNIYDYFGISENIVQNDFLPNQWNAFFEGVIEPIAIQMSEEFTNKIFNINSIKRGHKIVFTANRLQYADINSKIKLLQVTLPYGLLTKDTALELLDLPTLRGRRRSKDITIIKQYKFSYC